jgi:hypothetical protein
LIVDLTHAARTMVVMGDYFKTDAMFQTNTTINHDHISVSDGAGAPSVTSGGNVANNIADFVEHPGIYSAIPVTYAGPNWSVDARTIDGLLAGGATSLDPNLGNAIAGNGGTFRVNYISGNYYDVNAVWQNNVTEDVNVI